MQSLLTGGKKTRHVADALRECLVAGKATLLENAVGGAACKRPRCPSYVFLERRTFGRAARVDSGSFVTVRTQTTWNRDAVDVVTFKCVVNVVNRVQKFNQVRRAAARAVLRNLSMDMSMASDQGSGASFVAKRSV